MTLIHFLAESAPEPLCRAPEARSWLWTTAPARVTCSVCAALLREPAKRRERATDLSTLGAVNAVEAAANSADAPVSAAPEVRPPGDAEGAPAAQRRTGTEIPARSPPLPPDKVR